VRDAIAVPESGRVEKTYRLKRWVSMNSLGWYSGDMHPHPPLKHIEDLMDAEDLKHHRADHALAGWREQAGPALRRSGSENVPGPLRRPWLRPGGKGALVLRNQRGAGIHNLGFAGFSFGAPGNGARFPVPLLCKGSPEQGRPARFDGSKKCLDQSRLLACLGNENFLASHEQAW